MLCYWRSLTVEVAETVKSFGLQEELKGSIGPSLDQGIFTLLFSSINPFPFIPRVVSRTYSHITTSPPLFLSSRPVHFYFESWIFLLSLVDCPSTLTSVIATICSTVQAVWILGFEPDIQEHRSPGSLI